MAERLTSAAAGAAGALISGQPTRPRRRLQRLVRRAAASRNHDAPASCRGVLGCPQKVCEVVRQGAVLLALHLGP